jgi:predicted 2-oxoglutarate/Fe(II)-dependent dioxygenase YbiX
MLSNAEYIAPGLIVYRNAFSNDLDLINRLEEILSNESNENKWRTAKTSTSGRTPLGKKYRECSDFAIKKNTWNDEGKSESTLNLEKIWEDCYKAALDPVEDYAQHFRLAPLGYWYPLNFVKYDIGEYIEVHCDHAYSHICVLSAVGYINDDYEGGELFFDKLNIKIKPKAGDLYLYPSTYLYSHSSLPVTSGTKYAIVTFLDYLEAPHTPEYQEIEKKELDKKQIKSVNN